MERQLEEQRREIERKVVAKKQQQQKPEKPTDPAIRAELEAQQERAKVSFLENFNQYWSLPGSILNCCVYLSAVGHKPRNLNHIYFQIPLDERIKQFREMLEEKKVSASSTWERELSKIVFDSRYLLLSADERKAAFAAYQRERSEVEKVERKKRAKEANANYKEMLEEADLHGK
jgi:hypothetical protein